MAPIHTQRTSSLFIRPAPGKLPALITTLLRIRDYLIKELEASNIFGPFNPWWALPNDSKRNEASFSTILMDLLDFESLKA